MGWEHIDTISSPRNKERVEKQVFPDKDIDTTKDVKQLYADVVRNEC